MYLITIKILVESYNFLRQVGSKSTPKFAIKLGSTVDSSELVESERLHSGLAGLDIAVILRIGSPQTITQSPILRPLTPLNRYKGVRWYQENSVRRRSRPVAKSGRWRSRPVIYATMINERKHHTH